MRRVFSKTDYIYNTEHQLGVSSFEEIFDTPFAKRWPSFARQLSVNSTSRGWASPAGWNVSHNVVLNCSKKVCLNAAYWLYPNITNHAPNRAMCDDELENWTRVSKEPFMNGLETVVDADWSQFPEAAGAGKPRTAEIYLSQPPSLNNRRLCGQGWSSSTRSSASTPARWACAATSSGARFPLLRSTGRGSRRPSLACRRTRRRVRSTRRPVPPRGRSFGAGKRWC